jgi:hypothetical protein
MVSNTPKWHTFSCTSVPQNGSNTYFHGLNDSNTHFHALQFPPNGSNTHLMVSNTSKCSNTHFDALQSSQMAQTHIWWTCICLNGSNTHFDALQYVQMTQTHILMLFYARRSAYSLPIHLFTAYWLSFTASLVCRQWCEWWGRWVYEWCERGGGREVIERQWRGNRHGQINLSWLWVLTPNKSVVRWCLRKRTHCTSVGCSWTHTHTHTHTHLHTHTHTMYFCLFATNTQKHTYFLLLPQTQYSEE